MDAKFKRFKFFLKGINAKRMISHHGTLTLVDKLEFKILHLYVTIYFQKTFSKKASGSLNGMSTRI